MRSVLISAAMVAACTLSGCATVRSVPHNGSVAEPSRGLTYYLPMRMARMVAVKTQVNITNLISDRDKAVTALASARTAAAAAATAKQQAQTALDQTPAASADRPLRAQVLERATTDDTAAATALRTATTNLQNATTALTNAQITGASCTFGATIELLPAQGDRRAPFVLQPRHNELRNDTNKFVVTPAGLLTSANVVADDQTGQIIVEIAGIAGALTGGQIRGPGQTTPKVDCGGRPEDRPELRPGR